VWEQLPEGSGIYHHHHNWDRLCFPNQVAEVDEGNPRQEWPVELENSAKHVEEIREDARAIEALLIGDEDTQPVHLWR